MDKIIEDMEKPRAWCSGALPGVPGRRSSRRISCLLGCVGKAAEGLVEELLGELQAFFDLIRVVDAFVFGEGGEPSDLGGVVAASHLLRAQHVRGGFLVRVVAERCTCSGFTSRSQVVTELCEAQ